MPCKGIGSGSNPWSDRKCRRCFTAVHSKSGIARALSSIGWLLSSVSEIRWVVWPSVGIYKNGCRRPIETVWAAGSPALSVFPGPELTNAFRYRRTIGSEWNTASIHEYMHHRDDRSRCNSCRCCIHRGSLLVHICVSRKGINNRPNTKINKLKQCL